MNCPNCHGKSKVINAHYLPKRRRECLTCKARWTTVEVPRDEWDRLQRIISCIGKPPEIFTYTPQVTIKYGD